ncbi:MAG: nicotinate (nicotinamide) nucleotide adenylyltransferase [Oscillospiraceae bacterium]|nr:nicotinate (nicotinamide) nucleotide adenylyltransferase [Oscillospiraceae bacterium]
MARIGIFGGSFNPPHNGHLRAAEICKEQLGLDTVFFIPAAQPPHKSLAEGSPDAQERLHLTKLAVKGHSWAQVSDAELRRSGMSYTVDTLRQFCKDYPNDELFLLMGTDMFCSFSTWREPHEIAKLATVVCMMRTKTNPKLSEQLNQCAEQYRKEYHLCIEFLENEAVEISSTEVRRMLFFGCGEAYIQKAVLDEIKCKGLYATDAESKNLTFDRLRERSLSLHAPKRVNHADGCSQLAAELAEMYCADRTDAMRAGILHDITKALTTEQHLMICERYAVALTDDEKKYPKLLHAPTGAAIAKHIFGENDAVCTAIRWHTTGRANMSLLEKIVYIADYAEPNRTFEGVERLRYILKRDLDAAVLMGLEMSIQSLVQRNLPISDQSASARDFLLNERDEISAT